MGGGGRNIKYKPSWLVAIFLGMERMAMAPLPPPDALLQSGNIKFGKKQCVCYLLLYMSIRSSIV